MIKCLTKRFTFEIYLRKVRFNLRSGAFGQSIGHDSHNVIVTGTNHSDMALCANAILEMKGGIVLVQDGQMLGSLPLPFAGLLSTRTVEEVNENLEKLHEIINGDELLTIFIK